MRLLSLPPRRTRVRLGGAGRGEAGRSGEVRARRARVRRACWSGSRGLLAGRQVMRVTMATHQRKCILQETLIPSPRSWDSLTFHSHTVIRYQLSVQGGRLHGCSPACGGGAHKGGGGDAGRRALKTQGRFPAVGQGGAPPPVASLQARVRSPGDPARAGPRPLRTHLLRARAPACPPSRSPSPSPASPLPAHLPCARPPPPSPRDAAHLSFVRAGTIRSGQLPFRERPLCARRCAKPDLCNPHRPCVVGASAVPRPRRSGVWPFARGHAELNPIPMPISPSSYSASPSHPHPL